MSKMQVWLDEKIRSFGLGQKVISPQYAIEQLTRAWLVMGGTGEIFGMGATPASFTDVDVAGTRKRIIASIDAWLGTLDNEAARDAAKFLQSRDIPATIPQRIRDELTAEANAPTFSFTLTYPAHVTHIETGEPPLDLAPFDSVSETTLIPDFLQFMLPEDLHIRTVDAALVVAEGRLLFEIVLETSREPAAADLEIVKDAVESLFDSSWNYEFEMPEGFDDYQAHFSHSPL